MTLKEVDHRFIYEAWSIIGYHKVSMSIVGQVLHLDVVGVMVSDQRPQEVPGVRDIAEEVLAAMRQEHGDMGRNG